MAGEWKWVDKWMIMDGGEWRMGCGWMDGE